MKLFFVSDINEDGDNFDLFVIANTPEEVTAVWRAHYGRDDEEPQFVYRVAAVVPVGFHEKPHALEWHGANLPRVGGSRPTNPR